MKLTTILILISLTASAQRISVNNGEIEMRIDSTESIKSAFKTIARLTPLNMKWYDRYVTQQGVTYYKPGIRFSRKTYRVEKGDLIPVRF